jgi:hypothetical protein
MVQIILQWLFKIIGLKQRVCVLCHRAFLFPSGPECYFINVTNLSLKRNAEITHVWMTCPEDGVIHVINLSRPLPYRLNPEGSWETWIEVNCLQAPIRENAFCLARVRLSNGKVLHSRKNTNVPSAGFIPGS